MQQPQTRYFINKICTNDTRKKATTTATQMVTVRLTPLRGSCWSGFMAGWLILFGVICIFC